MRSVVTVLVIGLAVIGYLAWSSIRFDLARTANAVQEVDNGTSILRRVQPISSGFREYVNSLRSHRASPLRDGCRPVKAYRCTRRGIVQTIWERSGYGWEWSTVLRIVRCESRWKSWVTGDLGNSLGLFQIHRPSHEWRRPLWWWDTGWWKIPAENARLALEIRKEAGWSPWSCSR